MIRKQYSCDRCGDNIESIGLELDPADIQTDPKLEAQFYDSIHLCEGCTFQFRQYMEDYRAK